MERMQLPAIVPVSCTHLVLETFRRLQGLGIRTIIAHGERYLFPGAEALLYELADSGALIQVNTASFLSRPLRKKALQLIDHRSVSYTHLILPFAM